MELMVKNLLIEFIVSLIRYIVVKIYGHQVKPFFRIHWRLLEYINYTLEFRIQVVKYGVHR